MNVDRQAFDTARTNATRALLAQRDDAGRWRGRLSSSALSTATAIGALTAVDATAHRELIDRAGRWLLDYANDDGGWGDTPESPSNLSTTLLAWAALTRAEIPAAADALSQARGWLESTLGVDGLTPTDIAGALGTTYGRDRTFAVPILTFLAILDPLAEQPTNPSAFWKHIPPLPFELAALPHRLLRRFRADVVSYALPALIAVGQVGHHYRPTRMPLRRLLRRALRGPTLRKLRRIQPESGGYLEAAPLTSFVAVSLAAIDQRNHPVVQRAVAFLQNTVRDDGSWPIDTDLATWVSTLAVNALANGNGPMALDEPSRATLREWLLAQQHCDLHPYTQSPPGGWAWTDRSGGVPDVDDTAGAIRALLVLDEPPSSDAIREAAGWLLNLQNRDGGWPTFCRGWGKLPFDQSCPDLTAHAMGALATCRAGLDAPTRRRSDTAIEKGLAYLHRTQRPDGAWVPLWFGNQHSATGVNPVFGTARVLSALADLTPDATGQTGVMLAAAVGYLLTARNPAGTWGGEQGLSPTLEETAAVVEAFGRLHTAGFCDATVAEEIAPAVAWLIERTHQGQRFPPAPIGLYFARLWYHEQLYPLTFTLAALNAVEPLR